MHKSFVFRIGILLSLTCLNIAYGQQSNEREDTELKERLGRSVQQWDSIAIYQYAQTLKKNRGFELGWPNTECSKKDVVPQLPETEELNKYFELAVDHWSEQEFSCPEAPGNHLSGIVGIIYGFQDQPHLLPKDALENAIEILADQQFSSEKSADSKSPIQTPGAFGLPLFFAGEPCVQTGNLQRRILTLYKEQPDFFQLYTSGRFKGIRFLVQDQNAELGWQDAPLIMHFHWATEILAAAIAGWQDSMSLEILKRAEAWARQELPTTQIVQNARMVWALSNFYNITNDKKYSSTLLKWINLSIKPFLIRDENNDGLEDESLIKLDSLNQFSRMPGRPFDGPSANLWNSSIVATALLKAYRISALQKDSALKKVVKPLAISTARNVLMEAKEGFLPENGTGFRDLAYLIALLIENEKLLPADLNQKSKEVLAQIWGTGYLRTGGLYTAPLGILKNALSVK